MLIDINWYSCYVLLSSSFTMFVPCLPQLCIHFSATADFKPGAYSGRNQPVIGLPHICEGIQIGPEARQADNSTAAEESAATEEKHSAWKEHGQKNVKNVKRNVKWIQMTSSRWHLRSPNHHHSLPLTTTGPTRFITHTILQPDLQSLRANL